MTDLTYDERSILMHTMDLDRSKEAYRNFFAAGPEHADMLHLESLVGKGYMVKETSAISPDFIFRVTKAGKEALQAYWRS